MRVYASVYVCEFARVCVKDCVCRCVNASVIVCECVRVCASVGVFVNCITMGVY